MAKSKKPARTPYMREEVRQERLLRDREALRVLRQHFTGYDAKDGYSLDPAKLEKLPAAKRRALRKKYAKVAPLLAGPHDLIKPANKKQKTALRTFAHKKFRNAKHVIVQVPSQGSHVRFVQDRPEVVTAAPGEVVLRERLFLFPRRAKSHEDMQRMLDRLLEVMPKGGEYVMLTDTYGDTGDLATRGALKRLLRDYLGAYDQPKYGEHRFMNRIIGFRWFATEKEGQRMTQERSARRAAQRAVNAEKRAELAREAAQRARKKTGRKPRK
jgi:hypothetical protein